MVIAHHRRAEHWRELFRSELAEDFPARSNRIGEVHVAIDLPSGMSADTSDAIGASIEATVTVTLKDAHDNQRLAGGELVTIDSLGTGYSVSSVTGLVSSNRSLQTPPNSAAMPKSTQMALA